MTNPYSGMSNGELSNEQIKNRKTIESTTGTQWKIKNKNILSSDVVTFL